MKNVLFVLNNLNGGGAERVIVNIANGFVKNGIEVHLLLGKNEGPYSTLLHPKITLHELNTTSLLGYVIKLFPFLKGKKYSHIFTASDYTAAALNIVQLFSKRKFKIICTIHYDIEKQIATYPIKSQILTKLIYKFLLVKADWIIGVSDALVCTIKNFIKNDKIKVIRIYNPVFDDTIFELAKDSTNQEVKHKYTIISIGRLDKGKNQQLLIEAVNILIKKGFDILVYLIGEGSERSNLENLIHQYQLEEHVILLGYQNNPFKYLNQADLLVSSSNYEGFGNTIVEALALGINVLSTNCSGGPMEILNHGEYGWICDVDDSVDMSMKMEVALKNPKSKAILMQRATLYHADCIIQQYLNLIKA